MGTIRIAVIFPSRGLAFSETCEELLANLEGYKYEIFFAHELPIPDCFNEPLERALRGKFSHFWFVEEDMVLRAGTLKAMLDMEEDAVTCNYPVTANGQSAVYTDPDKNVIFSGTGCLLVTRKFLEQYKKPIFRADIQWDMQIGEQLKLVPHKITNEVYGFHDVNFGLIAYAKGNPIKLCKTVKCGQRKLVALGEQGVNNGAHSIQYWMRTKKTALFGQKLTKKKELYGNVYLSDGTQTFMKMDRAKELEKLGKVTIPPYQYVSIENNEVSQELL